jgi:hypothetical protein
MSSSQQNFEANYKKGLDCLDDFVGDNMGAKSI